MLLLNSAMTARKPFCKVCYDACNPDFDKHNIRKRGAVVCPYLLSITSPNCNQKGHTVKYCPLNKTKTKTKTPSTINMDICTFIPSEDFDVPPVEDIVWGKGFKDTPNNWADVMVC